MDTAATVPSSGTEPSSSLQQSDVGIVQMSTLAASSKPDAQPGANNAVITSTVVSSSTGPLKNAKR